MGEALYRKYRPKYLNEVVGQPHITRTLDNAIQQGRISHGYLFTGPRGVGKTSVARILAHQINKFAYGDSRGSLDIIEIDAASNRRIDEIRDLRDKVHIAPVTGKYKVYIIDEVHMLTREAFNALLKTLEEPPAHVVFILATTEAHKLPETIVSRTQRYTFKPVSQKEISNHLKNLAKEENITISDEALALIATHSEGSFRDSISLLDQLSSHKKITDKEVRELLGLPPETIITHLLTATKEGNTAAIVEIMQDADNNGYSAAEIAHAFSKKVRDQLINNKQPLGTQTIAVLEKLLMVSASMNPKDYLEIILLDIALSVTPPSAAHFMQTDPRTDKVTKIIEEEPQKSSGKKEIPTNNPTQNAKPLNNAELTNAIDNGLWENVLETLKQKHNTLYGVARMASPSVEEDTLVLSVPFAFHNKRLSEEKNSAVINTILFERAGKPIAFVTRIDDTNIPKTINKSTMTHKNSDTIAAVKEIFGGGEILES